MWLAYLSAPVLRRELRGQFDIAHFIAWIRLLSRCTVFGQPLIADCHCDACERRRELLPGSYTGEEQQTIEAAHGSLDCERGPKFEK